jgi:UDP-glucuronate 4-epimerase
MNIHSQSEKECIILEALDQKKILITGAAGFIGYHLSKRILAHGGRVHGLDNMNAYYDVQLKKDRLMQLETYPGFSFTEGDLSHKETVDEIFKTFQPDIVVNLAAQAGVRYSIDHPREYIDSNIIGFFNILEACRYAKPEHLIFASSSSVYGNQQKTPFSTTDPVDHPISLYAATKKSDELMAYTYSHLYGIPATGLRFFTVYGPFGRPDMAYFKFANKIMKDEPITIYNHGDMYRDFTFVDDIVTGVENMLLHPPVDGFGGDPYKIYNIGNNKPVKLMTFIETLEKVLGKTAKKEYLPMQPGDVYQTYADVTDLEKDFGFKPATTIEQGLKKFAQWYKAYYGIE